jgi:hypothetical protein
MLQGFLHVVYLLLIAWGVLVLLTVAWILWGTLHIGDEDEL